MGWGLVQALLGRRRDAVNALSQVHRTSRSPWMRNVVEPYVLANRAAIYRETGLLAKQDLRPFFGNRLMVLKAPVAGGEKGVLFVMFSAMFQLLHSSMKLDRLLNDYTLVFEPSWSGYCHPGLLEYTRWNDDIFILAAEENDFTFLKHFGSNLIPVGMGPCDWVDPRAAAPYLENPKEFDIVMNSSWGPWKRHYVLFHMLRHAKRRFTAALIGSKWGDKTGADVARLARFYGVADQVKIFESIPYEQVMDITCRSKVSILLSLKEGANRAIAESIFCNVPVVVLSNNIGGARKNLVPETGLLTEEKDLESTIDRLHQSNLHPREWGLEHISCLKSTEKLNRILREYALRQARPWTQDIAVRSNSPESKYLSTKDAERLSPWNDGLENYLR